MVVINLVEAPRVDANEMVPTSSPLRPPPQFGNFFRYS